MMQSLLNDALDYAARGWPVLPVHTVINGQCTCGQDCNPRVKGKHPHTKHGHKDASTDPAQIQEWFDLWPNANVGIVTGERSKFFAFEIDPRNGGNETLAEFELLHGPLPETVSDRTGGGGVAHLLQTPKEFTVPSTNFPGIDVIAEGKYILAPASLHKSGHRYEWLKNPNAYRIETAPDWLIETLQAKALERTHRETQTLEHVVTAAGGPPRLAMAYLHGTLKRQYKTRSEAEQAAITSLVNAGWHFEDVLALFHKEAHARTHFAELQHKPREQERWLKLSYDNAVKFVQTHESKGTKIARERRTWALSFDWQGRTRNTDQAVTLAHCEIAERSGREIYHASTFEIAERAGISEMSASRAHKRLESKRLQVIERIQDYDPHKPSQAIVWKLKPPKTGGGEVLHSQEVKNVSEFITLPHLLAHDVFRVRRSRTRKMLGLGKIGARVWLFLQDMQPHSIKEISRKNKYDRKATRKLIAKMYTAGMVRKIGDKWQALAGVDLDSAADTLGMAGTAEAQKRKHADERRHRAAELRQGGQA